MKYVILIHSNPQPWGHPTQRLTDEGRAQSEEWHDQRRPRVRRADGGARAPPASS